MGNLGRNVGKLANTDPRKLLHITLQLSEQKPA